MSYIDTPHELEAFCQQLKGSLWLALDTEFIRDRSYYPQLCLLQVSDGELAACIDPLAIDDLAPLEQLIYDPVITKVFHAGRQDLEIFLLKWGRLPQPLFDTQLAATLLGLGEQVGYGNLVETRLGISLAKGQARTDWSRRPLEPAQIDYALDDVIHLGPLYLSLFEELQKLGRENWLNEDFRVLADPATYQIPEEMLWQKIKGQQQLKGLQLAVLQQLAIWREQRAKDADRPRRWILKDEIMLEMARRQPKSTEQLERIRGVEQGLLKRQGQALLECIAKASQLPREQWPKAKKIPARLSPNQEALCDLLMAGLRLLAREGKISPAALASRRDLEQLVKGDRDLDLLHGWKGALAGKRLLALLEGHEELLVEQGRLQLRAV